MPSIPIILGIGVTELAMLVVNQLGISLGKFCGPFAAWEWCKGAKVGIKNLARMFYIILQ